MNMKCLIISFFLVCAYLALAQNTLPIGGEGFEPPGDLPIGMDFDREGVEFIKPTPLPGGGVLQTLPGDEGAAVGTATPLPPVLSSNIFTSVEAATVETEKLQRWSDDLEFCMLNIAPSEFKVDVEQSIKDLNRLPLAQQIDEKTKALKILVNYLSKKD